MQLEIENTVQVDSSEIRIDTEVVGVTIPGFELIERLGSGGYGDVWKAIGPGDLPKAVKVLHGVSTGSLAESELKSLKKLRDVRHPFLLNVERIECLANRIVIVTELADCSLQDRFEECTKGGSRGIPRDELIHYLRDAADALDFMFQQHDLQHLDIKPSNLLIQSGRIKVADFGLINQVSDSGHASIGGFTPLYAAPEVFEGRPSRCSDQYSLAVLYQYLLTGVPPFSGRTPAQLTAQHLSSKPDVSALCVSDQGIVLRALSKRPGARFDKCCEFVERLERGSLQSPRSTTPVAKKSGVLPKPFKENADVVEREKDDYQQSYSQPANAKLETHSTPQCPSIVIGLGDVGGRITSRMADRWINEYALQQPESAVQFLYVDSDPDSINGVSMTSPAEGSPFSTLLTPLRDAKEYQASAEEYLEWLSRRWLYNMPRTRRVEGIRPLGRLAFVDNVQHAETRLKKLLEDLTSPNAISATNEVTSMAFDDREIDVYLVGACGGGTGSAMFAEMAQLLRKLEKQTPQTRVNIRVVITASNNDDKLARANSFACISELNWIQEQNQANSSLNDENPTGGQNSIVNDIYFISPSKDNDSEQNRHVLVDAGDYLWESIIGKGSSRIRDIRREGLNQTNESQSTLLDTDGFTFRSILPIQNEIEELALADATTSTVTLATLHDWCVKLSLGSRDTNQSSDQSVVSQFQSIVVNDKSFEEFGRVTHSEYESREFGLSSNDLKKLVEQFEDWIEANRSSIVDNVKSDGFGLEKLLALLDELAFTYVCKSMRIDHPSAQNAAKRPSPKYGSPLGGVHRLIISMSPKVNSRRILSVLGHRYGDCIELVDGDKESFAYLEVSGIRAASIKQLLVAGDDTIREFAQQLLSRCDLNFNCE